MSSHLFALEVFLYSVKRLNETVGSDDASQLLKLPGSPPPFSGRGIAIQFLDYPVLYMAAKSVNQSNSSTQYYNCGKRCMFGADPKEIQMLTQEVPNVPPYSSANFRE